VSASALPRKTLTGEIEQLHFVLFRLLGFSEVVQKQTLGEVGTRTVI